MRRGPGKPDKSAGQGDNGHDKPGSAEHGRQRRSFTRTARPRSRVKPRRLTPSLLTEGSSVLTRRTVLIAGSGVVAAGAVASAVGLELRHTRLPLELADLSPLVGERFRIRTDEGTRTVTLRAISGKDGAAATARRFTLEFSAPQGGAVPAAIHTLEHGSGRLELYLGPVDADGHLEAVVDRTV